MACCGGHRNRPAVCYPCPGLLKYFHLGFFSEKVLPKRIGFVTSSCWIRHKNTSQSLHLLKEAPRTAGFDVRLSSSSLTWRSRSELTAPSCWLWPDPSQPWIDFVLQERSLSVLGIWGRRVQNSPRLPFQAFLSSRHPPKLQGGEESCISQAAFWERMDPSGCEDFTTTLGCWHREIRQTACWQSNQRTTINAFSSGNRNSVLSRGLGVTGKHS